jgi:hypothetical protein
MGEATQPIEIRVEFPDGTVVILGEGDEFYVRAPDGPDTVMAVLDNQRLDLIGRLQQARDET